jgi:UDP-N-acetylglucosamine/UDP-N-acetylgalactosamine diphosphorylase
LDAQQVGIILLAGGQGTRLGFSKPKGMYNVGLPGGDTLFALQAQQIARLRVLAAEIASVPVHTIRLPWYVMTSPQTDKDTVQAFRDNNFYGLNPADVVFFSQGTLPCYTYEGKIIMENGYTVSSAPDGNGGIYHALVVRFCVPAVQCRCAVPCPTLLGLWFPGLRGAG